MRHNWTDEDDEKLMKSVEECLPNRELFLTREAWWAYVAGHAGLVTTPDSARSRWDRLVKERCSSERSGQNTWDKVAETVALYEQDLQERTFDAVEELKVMMTDMSDDIATLVEMWK
jgi:hypothetical protein